MTDALYDPRQALPPGLVLSRDQEAALVRAFDGKHPLGSADGVALCGPSPPPPRPLPRFVDCNPDAWGNAIDGPDAQSGFS